MRTDSKIQVGDGIWEEITVLTDIDISDVLMFDYPDFSDAMLCEAFSPELDRWLTEEELQDVDCDDVNLYIHENLSDFN